MLATVTNKGRGPLGLATLDRGIVMLEGGASALLDLADHLMHRAWAEAGQILVAPLTDKEARAARKRLDGESEARGTEQAEALAALPSAAPAEAKPQV